MAHELGYHVAGDTPQRQGDAVVVTDGVRRRPGRQYVTSPSRERLYDLYDSILCP